MSHDSDDLEKTVTQLLTNEEALGEIMNDPSLSLECEMLKKVQESLFEHLRYRVGQDPKALSEKITPLFDQSYAHLERLLGAILPPSENAPSLVGRVTKF